MGKHFYLALLAFLQHAVADVEPFINDARFDAGDYGAYPLKTYHSSSNVSPRMNMLSMNEQCRDGAYTMLTPRGNQVPKDVAAGPVIVDDAGDLVWAQIGWGSGNTYGLTVQEFKGKDYLTFWAGDDTVRGHGEGVYYMLDEHYNVAYELNGIGGLKGDLHEMKITPEGTALMTIYKVTKVGTQPDHRFFGGWIWESIIQEVDIETNKLIFEWHASDHYDIFDSYNNENIAGSHSSPYDFFHMNSIEKDIWGNYLISSRYMHSITYIEGSTGNILWVMGGKRNTFTDLSEGKAITFKWQHHARWHNNYTEISLFDNGADYLHTDEAISRGMLLTVDKEAQTVALKSEYINPNRISSSSQGSMQVRPNGNVLLGFGYDAAFTEFTHDGTPLCETHFGASSRWGTGDVQSYRVLKHNWVGYPTTNPDLAIVNNIAYVSWNGATEVAHWMVQGSVEAEGGPEFYGIKSIQKMGFETGISLDGIDGTIRIAAIDINGSVLGVTNALVVSVAAEMSHSGDVSDGDLFPLQMMVGIMTCVMAAMVLRECIGCMRRRKARAMGRIERNGDEEFLLARNPTIEVTQAE